MAVAEREYVSRRSSPAVAARAAKDKRQKRILIVVAILFLGLIAFQAPRLLNRNEAAAPAPTTAPADTGATATPAPAGGTATPAAPAPAPAPERARPLPAQFRAKDPFIPQVRTETSGAQGATASGGGAATPPPAPTPVPVPSGVRGSYTIVLASTPARRGGGGLGRTLARARAAGLGDVRIVNSSNYRGLRPGYFAVVSGTFANLRSAQRTLRRARVSGFPRAYTRRVGR